MTDLISLEDYIEKELETSADIMEKVREAFMAERESVRLPAKKDYS